MQPSGAVVTVWEYECIDRAGCTERLSEQHAVIKMVQLEAIYQNGTTPKNYVKSRKWDLYNGFTGK